MATTSKKQDMPPPGGYAAINFVRSPAKQYFSGYSMFLGFTGITTAALYLYYLQCKKIKREEIEMRSSRIALFPLLVAERDREYLKQLRRNRDEEAKLMANVEGWEVGKWNGEPIYRTTPPDTLLEPHITEYYVHAPYREFARRSNITMWH
ncbi:NADH dehydrogenase [ubiquinone] 1 alpha subcomplex subunit 13 [Ischnura elegans]|uniref:NADH dehydrogenase [ubiquinone] 1 alpha subcomplex subunit 13 n=1 Tax=Ischnura elegans TaxID=197161 RepID=UPI001ED88ADC|nr:NADH dehydrogenase [ubiquinone] 1 alpha subcomplex subunit 13 [Ischnura elegans]